MRKSQKNCPRCGKFRKKWEPIFIDHVLHRKWVCKCGMNTMEKVQSSVTKVSK